VVPVASVGAVGAPLTAETVHRPERVAAITDATVGDEITPELVGRVLAHERGGLKKVPDGATAIPLVNAVDDAADETAAAGDRSGRPRARGRAASRPRADDRGRDR